MTTTYDDNTPSSPSPSPSPWPPARAIPAADTQPLQTDGNIQGNVLAGFNKNHQAFLFLNFPNESVGRGFLGWLLPHVAHNDKVYDFNARFSAARKASGSDPANLIAVWTNVSLTANGLEQLDSGALDALKAAPVDDGVKPWLAGAADADILKAVGDTDDANSPGNWLFGGITDKSRVVHAVVCVAADRPQDLSLELSRHREQASKAGYTVVFEQPGATLPGAAAGHEHFGFKDGISQPGVTGLDKPSKEHPEQAAGKLGTDLISPGTFVLGYQRDDGTAVAVPKWMWDGSFLVSRRLAQDVAGFWSNVEEEYKTLKAGLPEPAPGQPDTEDVVKTDPITGIHSPDALAARLVGRWRSGTPTDLAPAADNRSAQDPANDNDFDFAEDLPGDKTPAVAHIRKVYPRSGATPALTEDDTKIHRIIRRGIPYGLPFAPTSGRGEGVDAERGLLFQCYQASLADGFVFIQQAWVNKETFTESDTGKDAVIGEASAITVRGGGQKATAHFQQWVNTHGSLFSFTPSIATLTALASGSALEGN